MAGLTGRTTPLTETGSVVAVRVDISKDGHMGTWATVEGVSGSQPHFGRAGESTIGALFRTLKYQMGQDSFQRKYCGRDTLDARDEISRLAKIALEPNRSTRRRILLPRIMPLIRKKFEFLRRLEMIMEKEYPGETDNIYIRNDYIRNDLIDHRVLSRLAKQKQNNQNQANLRSANFPALGAAAPQTPVTAPSFSSNRTTSGQVKQNTISVATQIEMARVGRPHIHVFLKDTAASIAIHPQNILKYLGMVRTTRFAPRDPKNDETFKVLHTRKKMTTPRTLERVLGAVVTPRMDPMDEDDEEEDEDMAESAAASRAASAAGKNGLVDMFENLTF